MSEVMGPVVYVNAVDGSRTSALLIEVLLESVVIKYRHIGGEFKFSKAAITGPAGEPLEEWLKELGYE
jgi:hypothetical protein